MKKYIVIAIMAIGLGTAVYGFTNHNNNTKQCNCKQTKVCSCENTCGCSSCEI